MAQNPQCVRCGNPLSSNGICPYCLLRAGLEPGSEPPGNGSAGEDVSVGFEPTQPGHVLESLARSIGSIPRVLLPDTAADDAGVAMIKPSSDEMPAPASAATATSSSARSPGAGWGRCSRAATPTWAATWPSRSCSRAIEDKPELVRRFVEEAQIGGQLQHPGIVPVYELGAFADRRPYFTMKLVKGRTLAALLAERQSPAHDLPRFLSIFEAICQTVAYAHAAG